MESKASSHLSETTCPLCRSNQWIVLHEEVEDFNYHIPGKWSFVRCLDCKIIYLNHWPENSADAYNTTYSQHGRSGEPSIKGNGSFARIKELMRRGVFQVYGYKSFENPWWIRLLGRFAILFPHLRLKATYSFLLFPKTNTGSHILDIGCGNGRFLAMMKMLGLNVYGIEPDPISRDQARHLCGAILYPSLQDAQFQGKFFDVITLNHSLEHIAHPVQLLHECHRILNDDGKIGICVPNWQSLGHRFWGKYWYHLDAPRHLIMYDLDRLKGVLDQSGFVIRTAFTTSIRLGKITFQKSWRYKTGKPPQKFFVSIWVFLNALTSFILRKSGEELVVWATKKVK